MFAFPPAGWRVPRLVHENLPGRLQALLRERVASRPPDAGEMLEWANGMVVTTEGMVVTTGEGHMSLVGLKPLGVAHHHAVVHPLSSSRCCWEALGY